MDPIFCPNCGAQNPPEAEYCVVCHTALSRSDGFYADDAFELGAIDGISGGDMSTFIGKKANAILPRFFTVSGGSKTAWCWPAAIWGVLLGPVGVAIWLFWRKMQKQAWLFLAVAMLLTAIPMLRYAVVETKVPSEVYRTQYNRILKETEQSNEMIDATRLQMAASSSTVGFYFEKYTAYQSRNGLNYLVQAVRVLSALIGGFFGYVWYKNFAVKRIKQFRDRNRDPRYYQLGLMRQGSTSGGLVVLGLVVYYVLGMLTFAVAFQILLK